MLLQSDYNIKFLKLQGTYVNNCTNFKDTNYAMKKEDIIMAKNYEESTNKSTNVTNAAKTKSTNSTNSPNSAKSKASNSSKNKFTQAAEDAQDRY